MNQLVEIRVRESDRSHFRVLDWPEGAQAAALLAYWQSKRKAEASLPSRADMRFEELVKLRLADSVFILEPVANGRDWRYRLIGSMITQMFNYDATGQTLHEVLSGAEANEAVDLSCRVARSWRPMFFEARFATGGYTGPVETMSLPVLAPDGETVWLFGGTFFNRAEFGDGPVDADRWPRTDDLV